jgi:hypothetical protein
MNTRNSRKSERGLTIVEALVAVTVFTVVFIAALMLYSVASNAYLRTDSAVIQQQNIRFAMDRMSESIRDAGAGYNMLGITYKVADEQIEGAWESAIFVRGDFDNAREDNLQNGTYPIVTTGNDEIVGYVLLKDGGGTTNISIKADFTVTGGRDAVYTDDANIAGEETATLGVAAIDVAGQSNPPYQLAKVTFDDSGNPQTEILADNIRQLKFEYYTESGTTPITIASGADGARDTRKTIRKVVVKLVGQSDKRDLNYTADDGYRTFPLEQVILPPNLGIIGGKHAFMPTSTLPAPAYITTCTGHCRKYWVQWPSAGANISVYSLQITAPSATGSTGAVTAYSEILTVGNLFYEFTEPDEDVAAGVSRQFTFKVASVGSGGVVGTYTPAVSMQSTNKLPESVPQAPTNVTATSAAPEYALLVNWDPVTQNVQPLATNLCQSAGVGSAGNSPPPPWDQKAVDISNAKVYRIRSTGSNGNFAIGDAGVAEVSQQTIGALQNVPSQGPFMDRTAAPCTPYFYRAKSCDTCGELSTISAAMNTDASFDIPSDVFPAQATNLGATGPIASGGGNYNFTLRWDPVVTTADLGPAATAHYRVIRSSKTAAETNYTNPEDIDVYEVAGLVQSVPMRNSQNDELHYRYQVQAVYDCASPRQGALSAPFDITCTTPAGVTVAVTRPVASDTYTRPAETTVPLQITATGATFIGATLSVSGPASFTPTSLSGAPGLGGIYDFGTWNIAPDTIPDGDYIVSGTVTTTAGCQVAATPITFTIETIACGQRIVNMTVGGTGTSAGQSMRFKIENTCTNAVTINRLVSNWTGVNPSVRITGLSGAVPHVTGVTIAPGENLNLTTPIVLPAAVGTTPSVFPLGTTFFTFTFNDNFTSDQTENPPFGQFTSILANVTVPAPAKTEQLVDGGAIP